MKLESWARPTINWDLKCETEKSYSRNDGIIAASTHIDSSRSAERFDNIGIWMLIMFSILLVLHFCFAVMPVAHCCTLILFLIFVPVALSRVPTIMEENRQNILKLVNFTALNECADKYTNIDVERVDSELDLAHSALESL